MFIFSFGSMIIAKASFGTFVCSDVGDKSVLLADLSIECEQTDARYASLTAWSVFGVMQVVVLPLLFVPIIYFARFYKGGWSKDSRDRFVSFLYDSYTDDCWFYECVRILKKVLIVLISKVVPRPGLQLMWTQMLLIGCIILVTTMKPYTSTAANRLEVGASALLAFCLVIASAFFVGNHAKSEEAEVMAVVVIVLLVMPLIAYVVVLAKYHIHNSPKSDSTDVQQRGGSMVSNLRERFSLMFMRRGSQKSRSDLPIPPLIIDRESSDMHIELSDIEGDVQDLGAGSGRSTASLARRSS
jgi:hypothetical protein